MSATIFDYDRMPTEHVSHCPACGEFYARWWMEGYDRYGYDIQLKTCRSCGLTYLKNRMSREQYAEFYAGTYRRLCWNQANPGQPYDEAAYLRRMIAGQRVYAQLVTGWLQHFPVPQLPRILDAGGGTGEVGKIVAAQFNAAQLVVLDPAAQELPKDLVAIQGVLEDPIPGGPFELILCCETADHLLDPAAAFRNMRDALSTDGLLYIDAVDKASWAPYHGYKIDHPLYWSGKPLLKALKAAGLTVLGFQKFMHTKRWKVRVICTVSR